MTFINFLAQRRKAIVALIIGALNEYGLYLTLTALHPLTHDDKVTLVTALIIQLGGVALVHQASNKAIVE